MQREVKSATIAAHSPEIQGAIDKLGLLPLVQNASAIGRLNTIEIFSNSSGEKFCLRRETANNRGWVKSYLQDLYDNIAGQECSLEVRYRTVKEQVSHMKRLLSLGIKVPEVVAHGTDWMLMSYLDGNPLSAILPSDSTQGTQTAITALMNAWTDAHSKGECLWDRCGKNELFHEPRTIAFIDFDIDVHFSTPTPFGLKASYDLAMGVRSYFLQAQHKDVVLNTMKASLSTNKARSIYHLRHLSEVLEMQLAHYAKLASSPEQADLYAPQRNIEPFIVDLSSWLKTNHNSSHHFRRYDPR